MEIFYKILKEANRFMRETGQEPKYVYLGEDEYNAVRASNKAMAFFELPPGEKRREVCGMALFIVDAESHLGVGV